MNRRTFLSSLALAPTLAGPAAAAVSLGAQPRRTLTLGADVQADRVEILVPNWTPNVLQPGIDIRLGTATPNQVRDQIAGERAAAEQRRLLA